MEIAKLIIENGRTIKDAIVRLDLNGSKFLMVSEGDVLVGVITDGDIRRWILRNGDLNETVESIMNREPKVLFKRDMKAARQLMIRHSIESVPVLNQRREVQDCITWKQIAGDEAPLKPVDIPVVIMAGGMGSRLFPYTKILPKPLIPIGEVPIVERIINEFQSFGMYRFYMTVNYKKGMIKNYFHDIDKEYQLDFIEEETYLGTAGGLRNLSHLLQEPFFLSNCDILVYADYRDIMEFHVQSGNAVTMVASLKTVKIPYGVLKIGDDETVRAIDEKPEFDLLVNTGMYVLDASILDLIPKEGPFHMTDLVNLCIQRGIRVGTYPISENSWLDMGQLKEMEEMVRKLNV